ncbi:MAG: tetratricopeptide repeat protein, partial [Planctomycetota bacterium]
TRGDAKSQLGEFRGAIADYTLALQINPQNELIYLNRGVLYSQYKKGNEAKSDFLQFLKLTQHSQDPRILMAREKILSNFPEFRGK